ncbi:MAG: SDR family oxidoreductase [Leptolinea sp.]
MQNDDKQHLELAGKTALITGGSSGIGLAIAHSFVQAGASVAILARNRDKLITAAEEIRSKYQQVSVLLVTCDVTQEEDVQNAFKSVLQKFNRLDIVVSCAGSIDTASIEETSLALWQDMLAVHATGYFLVAREAIRCMKQQDSGGCILFISSDCAVKPTQQLIAYSAGKAVELHMARCIAEECGPFGIRINTILPSAVFGGSAFWGTELRESRAKIHGYDPSKLEDEYKKKNALGVNIYPEDVAEVALFLVSERSNKITGAVISLDGGGKTGYMR